MNDVNKYSNNYNGYDANSWRTNNRFKPLKKIIIVFLVFLVFFFGITPKTEKAEASALDVSMATTATLSGMAALYPAIFPVIVIGFFGVLLVGFSYSNWDEIYAFGTAISNELGKIGYKAADFVTGTTVSMNNTLKQAIYNAADSIDNEMSVSVNFTDNEILSSDEKVTSNYPHITTNYKYFSTITSRILDRSGRNFLSANTEGLGKKMHIITEENMVNIPSHLIDAFIYVNPFEFTVRFEPIATAPTLTNRSYSGTNKEIDYSLGTDANGNYISLTGIVPATSNGSRLYEWNSFSSVLLRNNSWSENLDITRVEVPAYGIGSQSPPAIVDTSAFTQSGYTINARERLADLVFPPNPSADTEEIEFKPEAIIMPGLGILDFPELTDKTIEEEDEKAAKDIVTGEQLTGLTSRVSMLENGLNTVRTTMSSLPDLIVSGIGNLFSWLQGLLEQILNAILGLPAAISAAATNIVNGIRELPEKIAVAIETALDWLQGLPASISAAVAGAISGLQTGLENLLEDLGQVWTGLTDGLVNIGENIWNVTQRILDNLINGINTFTGALSDIWSAIKDGTATLYGAIESGVTALLDGIVGLVVPSAVELEAHKGRLELFFDDFRGKFEFITVPIQQIRNVFGGRKSLYDVTLTLEDKTIHVLPRAFKPAVDFAKPIFTGVFVILTYNSIWKRFRRREVLG